MQDENVTVGIRPLYEAFYIHSMLFNSQSAMNSIENIEKLLELIMEDHDIDINNINDIIDVDYLLNNIQNVVLQAGALSRYFWPTENKNTKNIYRERSKYLKSKFNITEENLLKNRKLRNSIEHFDENLDNYLRNDIVGHIIPQFIGISPISNGVPLHIFRAYYFDTGKFEILGRRFNISSIFEEIKRIHEYLIFFDQNGGSMREKPLFSKDVTP